MLDLTYLLFNICLIVFAILLLRKTKVIFSWESFFLAFILVSIPFIIWDIWAVSVGHWGFNSDHVVGVNIFGIAVEEALFFLSVPLVMTVIFLVLNSNKLLNEIFTKFIIVSVGLSGLLFTVLSDSRGYTHAIGLATFIISILLIIFFETSRKVVGLWKFQLLLFGLFLVANTFLTAVPVIVYGGAEMIGFKVGTIPIEDFLYNFVLVNGFITVYLMVQTKQSKL